MNSQGQLRALKAKTSTTWAFYDLGLRYGQAIMNNLFSRVVLQMSGYEPRDLTAARLQRQAAQEWQLAQIFLHGDGTTLAEIMLLEGAKKRGLPLSETQLRLRAAVGTQIRAAELYRLAREAMGVFP